MSISRKHFVAIAATLAANRPAPLDFPFIPELDALRCESQLAVWTSLRDDLASTLAAFNPNFDRSTFVAATESTTD